MVKNKFVFTDKGPHYTPSMFTNCRKLLVALISVLWLLQSFIVWDQKFQIRQRNVFWKDQCCGKKFRWVPKDFFLLLPKTRTYFCVRLIDGTARIFPTSYAATEIQTHVSSVAPLLRDLNPGRFTDWATAAAARVPKRLNAIKRLKQLTSGSSEILFSVRLRDLRLSSPLKARLSSWVELSGFTFLISSLVRDESPEN